MFTRNDARWLSDTAGALYRAQTVDEFTGAAMTALDDRFKLHSFACEELGAGGAFYRPHLIRCGVPAPADHSAYFHDNPFNWALGAELLPPVLHMRREVPFSRWSRTDHYNGIARFLGVSDLLMIVTQCQPTWVGVGLYRDTVFTERENALNRLVQPHIAAAWARVQPQSDFDGEPVSLRLHLSAQLQPIGLNPAQARLLRTYFPRSRASGELPGELHTWVRHSLEKLRAQPPPHPLYAFKVESARGRLLIRCFPAAADAAELHMVETPPKPNFTQLRAHGLTSRECEVLHWIAQGKRDSEIAAIIACSPATVGKHIENVLRKLHAENRGAAVSTARAWLGQNA